MEDHRKPYPEDITDDEWPLIAPCLTLPRPDAGQREHSLREVFDGLRYIVKTGAPWWSIPNDLPPLAAIYPQINAGLQHGVSEALLDDLRAVQRLAVGRTAPVPRSLTAGRLLTPGSGERAGYAGGMSKNGSMLYMAVDTRGAHSRFM